MLKDLKKGDDILSHLVAVPSALIGLTSLFGMGRGEPYRYNHLKFLVDFTGVIQVLSTATLVAIS